MNIKAHTLCFLTLLCAAACGRAQEPIRWKFQPGQRLSYSIVQEFAVTSANEGLEVDNQSRQQLDVTWEIESVNADGVANARLKFDRIRSKMTLPAGGLEYDSASDGPAIGMAAVNAPLYQALVKTPVQFHVTSEGRVTNVELPEEVQTAMKRMPTLATIGDLKQPERFQTLLLPGFPLLPPERSPSPGYQWQSKAAATLPGGETQTVESNYTYEGQRETEGKNLAVIRQLRTASIGNGDSSGRSIKEQSSESEILFDPAAGHLQSSLLKHRMTIDVKQGSTMGTQKVEQTVQVTLLSAGS
jgi:hypothetical protein